MNTESPDRMAMRVKLMLAILGAFLLLVGWYRWFSHAG
jgi:type II secretory pathway component PulM